MKGKFCLLMFGLFLAAAPLWAQEVTGKLEGRILDPEGQPLAGVQVTVSGPGLQGIREAKSDEMGYFRFFSLPTGILTVKVHHPAFLDIALEKIRIRLGGTTSLGDIRLLQKVQEAHEIVVTAKRPVIDLASAASGADLVAETIKDLPVARDYRSVISLLPSANQSYYGDEVNVSGATGSDNGYFIDGIDVSDPYGRLRNTSLPYNFVKEVELKTGGYEAEYRSSLGGLINAVTYSGGNEFSGQIFGFFTNNNFSQAATRSELQPSTGKFAQYDYGFSLGGPIVLDRLWFFGAFNPTTQREDVLIPGLGYHEDKLTQNIFAAKLTWQPSPRANVVFTAIGDPAVHNSVGLNFPVSQALNPDPMLTKLTEGGYNFLANGNYIFSDKSFIEARVSYITRRDRRDPETERGKDEILFVDEAAGNVVSGGHWDETYGDSQETTVSFKGTFVLSRHVLKAGIEYRDNRLNSFANQNVIFRLAEDSYVLQTFNESGILHNRIPSLFVQDSWKVTDNLQFNYGLRWSAEFWLASTGQIAQRITDEYQPRLGLIFSPGRTGSSKIYGSFGRFYQEFSTYLMTWYQVDGSLFKWIMYDHDPRLDPSGGVIGTETNGQIQPEVKGLEGQNYDEWTLGFDQALGQSFTFRALGIYRHLRNGVEDGMEGYGNPGQPPLEGYPQMKREYYGLEFSVTKSGGRYFDFMTSYTLSRSYGNYPGLFVQDLGDSRPNVTGLFDSPEEMIHATGLLPNDRPHVFKFFGSFRAPFGLTVGAFFVWESGTPLSEIGTQSQIPGWIKYLNRGKSGRTPAIADLNIRMVYQMKNALGTRITPRLILDIFHVGSKRTPLTYEERHYLGIDEFGNQMDPNPLYGHATSYFPPMSARLGLEINY